MNNAEGHGLTFTLGRGTDIGKAPSPLLRPSLVFQADGEGVVESAPTPTLFLQWFRLCTPWPTS